MLKKDYFKIKLDLSFIAAVILLFNLLILFTVVSQVNAKILIIPTRAVMEDGERTFTFTILNNEDQASTYRLSMENMLMTEEGRLVRADSAEAEEDADGQFLAKDLIHFSPRQVTVEADGRQTVRLQMMPKPDMAAGEYRAHIQFQEIPAEDDDQDQETGEEEISIGLTPVYGFSIPVIYRHGETSVDIELKNISLKESDGKQELFLEMQRRGNRSAYGNIEVYHISEDGGERLVGRIGGIAFYTEIEKRQQTVPLNFTGLEDLEKGELRIIYVNREGENKDILAEKYFENW